MSVPEYVWIYHNRQDIYHNSEYVSCNTQCEVTLEVNEYLLTNRRIQIPVNNQDGALCEKQL